MDFLDREAVLDTRHGRNDVTFEHLAPEQKGVLLPVAGAVVRRKPSGLRQQLHVKDGGLLVIRENEGRLVLESVDNAIRCAQALVRQYAPAAQNVTDKLLAERRVNAAHEWFCHE